VLRSAPPVQRSSSESSARVADLLVETLAHFGVDANVVGQISGPRVTRYELQLAPGTKVSKVAALKDDLSYALATTEIRILATILPSVLLRATPDEVRLILVDPKRVELNHYESIPHLLTPVVSSPKEASAVLANVVAEMERRYERLSSLRARNLPEANRAIRQRGEPTMPYLLVVIDELADLMMIAPQAVEDAVIRLAQKSRAVGIHLVLATQRPSVDVITGMIKANVPSRVAFAVSSQTDSRVILDQGGAESLLGQGDMLV